MRNIIASIAACVAFALAFGASEAKAQARVEMGLLHCSLSPGIGALAGSRRRMDCRLIYDAGRSTANYTGTITRFGIDVGATAGGLMSWRVFSRTHGDPVSAIAGHYVGVSADVSLGLGAGAKVLIGGSRRATMLQPLAFVGNVGLNFGVGIAGMTLRRSS